MEKKLTFLGACKFLSPYIFKRLRHFLMFYFGWFFTSVMSIVTPILFGTMIDEIVYYQNMDTFLQISLLYFLSLLFFSVLFFFIYAQHHYLMSMYTFDIRRDILWKTLKADAQYMNNIKSGDVVTTIQGYTTECMHFVVRNIIHITNGGLSIIALSIFIFLVSWEIGLFILLAAPLTVFVNAKFGRKMRKHGDTIREHYTSYIGWIFEVLNGLRDIRMLGASLFSNRKFTDANRNLFKSRIRADFSTMTAEMIVKLINLIVQLLIFVFAGYLASKGEITIGLLTIIMTLYGLLVHEIRSVSYYYLDAQNRVSYIQRIYDFIHAPSELEWTGKNELFVTKGDISCKDICFSYKDGSDVIKNFSLDIPGGRKMALAGKSGCGKTTLGFMMVGFYLPQLGEIQIDGQKLSDCTLTSIRDNIGIVQQEVLIFDGTVSYNLRQGNQKATEEELINACKKAGIWNFIDSLPEKLKTVVGRNGIGLSGGQKQRIAIARVYLRNPKIIIFDEATSALDSKTEEEILSAWNDILQDKTAIVIAHRQSSVMLCDEVALMGSGRILECGTPQGLFENSEAFRSLFSIKEAYSDVE